MKHVRNFESFLNEATENLSSRKDLESYLLDLIDIAAEFTEEDLSDVAGQSPRSMKDAVNMVASYIPKDKKEDFMKRAESRMKD